MSDFKLSEGWITFRDEKKRVHSVRMDSIIDFTDRHGMHRCASLHLSNGEVIHALLSMEEMAQVFGFTVDEQFYSYE